jgi:cell division protein FtsQ
VNPKKFAFRLKIVLLVLVALFSVYFILHNPLFSVTHLEVIGNERVPSEEIIARSGIVPGMNIFRFDGKAGALAIEGHPVVKQAKIERQWNKTVVIRVTERQVWAIIPYGDVFLCLDDAGVYFDKINDSPHSDGPIITLQKIPENIVLGQVLNTPAIEMVKQIWQAFPAEERAQISEFHYLIQDNSLNIYTLKGTEVRFGDLERLDEKVKSFAQVIGIENDMEKKGQDVLDYVDIRFKGEPVLKTRI